VCSCALPECNSLMGAENISNKSCRKNEAHILRPVHNLTKIRFLVLTWHMCMNGQAEVAKLRGTLLQIFVATGTCINLVSFRLFENRSPSRLFLNRRLTYEFTLFDRSKRIRGQYWNVCPLCEGCPVGFVRPARVSSQSPNCVHPSPCPSFK
jgi:hypothetical protein